MTIDTAPMIAILGGYGRVGATAARLLADEHGYRLRIGGRSADRAWRFARTLGDRAEAAVVDARDSQSLMHFTRGCATVLDCSGTAFSLRGRIRASVLAAGVHYVGMTDDGGSRTPEGTCSAVLFTGLSGTLAGWVPRWLADGLDSATRFSGWWGGLGAIPSHTAVSCLLGKERAVDLPGDGPAADLRTCDGEGPWGEEVAPVPSGFASPPSHAVAVRHVLPDELRQQAYLLRLQDARWHEVLKGPGVPAFLDRFALRRPTAGDGGDLMAAARELAKVSVRDAAGSSPYQVLYGTLDGLTADGVPVRRSALLHCTDVTGLVAVIASITAHEVTRDRVPSGVHAMAATLPPRDTADWIVRHLPRTTARTTEVPAGEPGLMTTSPAARRPG
ncbi:saccharopine dehydrogenase NADP-binding domain-containing protein [Streptomyces phaeoluteigriseus]|uniref:Saccharopine dehydrogenase NADP-binding domain-containing protein n=1 Tax=Streptomyces phaeoluteigriseus TaxID=114686 RepID=A0ABY4ZA57_9ACTN|nr:saccharopine dehydrogenase NADP-binding domain-containing protein [Streptomyces phaeoluteigriseus]USQ85699.1 saccharopine dehydrogenase NADP-binding domain-containing protein [Streptomyces phaeoluteigriseus]